MEKRLVKIYFSIMKAGFLGIFIASSGIFLFNIFNNSLSENKNEIKKINDVKKVDVNISKNKITEKDTKIIGHTYTPNVKSNTDIALVESDGEEDGDSTFISRFSRAAVYSSDSGVQVIESAKKSLPKTSKNIVTAKAYAVIDINRDVVVLEKSADKILPIASITKLVTAVIAKRNIKDNENITITGKSIDTYGNEAKLREGEKLKLREILYPLLMVSSNDSAEAIARHYGRDKFIMKMNDFVNEIGAYRTHFTDPSGLSVGNVSTANDLGIIIKWILKNEPDIFNITLEKTKTIRVHTWTNPTHFLNLDSYAGGKNGYTHEANRTTVALFKLGKQKRPFAVIFLGSSARDSDMLDLLEEAVR